MKSRSFNNVFLNIILRVMLKKKKEKKESCGMAGNRT